MKSLICSKIASTLPLELISLERVGLLRQCHILKHLCYARQSIRELIVDLSRFLVTQKGEFAFSACAFSLWRRVIDWNKWNAKEADVEVCFLFLDGERCDGRTD